jgi:hypothetical protein
MNRPIVSLYGAAIRPQNWLHVYECARSNISFEIVFVGPKEPNYPLPDNFKYIKSNVKPVQCVEIASRNTSGEFIVSVADDIEFKTPDPLDRLYNEYISYNDEKLVLSSRYMMNGVDISNECHRYPTIDPDAPLITLAGLVPRKIYMDIGGADRNFILAFYDIDISMRLHVAGCTIRLSDNVYINENTSLSYGLSRVLSDYGKYDQKLLESLWMVNGKMQLNRARPLEPFSDEKILEESQGPKGEWD